MLIQIVPFAAEYLESAARLVASQFESTRRQVSCLPAQYADPATLLPVIQEIALGNPGVAAFAGSELVGFLIAWRLPDFQGLPAAFSPELANAAILEDRQKLYEAMYAALAETWVAEGYKTHLISLLANDISGIETFNWLGFGMLAADALRDLSPVPAPPADITIRRGQVEDAPVITALDNALDAYLSGPPVYISHAQNHTTAEVRAWLENPLNAFWIAWEGDLPLGFIAFGPASQDACQVIVDQHTTSISAAYTIPAARNQGVAAALLDHGLDWARAQGYSRCAVDFEPMNSLARRFWLRYFQPVSYTLCRRVF